MTRELPELSITVKQRTVSVTYTSKELKEM